MGIYWVELTRLIYDYFGIFLNLKKKKSIPNTIMFGHINTAFLKMSNPSSLGKISDLICYHLGSRNLGYHRITPVKFLV